MEGFGGFGAWPRGSGRGGPQGDGDMAHEGGVWSGGGEGYSDAVGGFSDKGADLGQPDAHGGELGLGQRVLDGHGIAQGEHQPVGGGVQNQAELVGDEGFGTRSGRKRAGSCAA